MYDNIKAVKDLPNHHLHISIDAGDIHTVLAAMGLPANYAIAAGLAAMNLMNGYDSIRPHTAYALYRAMTDKLIHGPATGMSRHMSGKSPVPVHMALGVFAAARLVRMKKGGKAS